LQLEQLKVIALKVEMVTSRKLGVWTVSGHLSEKGRHFVTPKIFRALMVRVRVGFAEIHFSVKRSFGQS